LLQERPVALRSSLRGEAVPVDTLHQGFLDKRISLENFDHRHDEVPQRRPPGAMPEDDGATVKEVV